MHTLTHTHTLAVVCPHQYLSDEKGIFSYPFLSKAMTFMTFSTLNYSFFQISIIIVVNPPPPPPPPAMLTHLLSLRYDVKVWLQSDRLAGTLEKYTSKTVVRFRMRHIKSYYFN